MLLLGEVRSSCLQQNFDEVNWIMNRASILLGPRNWYEWMRYVPRWCYDSHDPKSLVASAPALIIRTRMQRPYWILAICCCGVYSLQDTRARKVGLFDCAGAATFVGWHDTESVGMTSFDTKHYRR
jgi:hypothetical protein